MHKVSAASLRQRFNRLGFEARVAAGELAKLVLKDRHPSPPRANEPICTQSQLIGYFTRAGVKLAEAHQYVRQDGTIGASGMPDPKKVVDGQDLYFV